MSMQCRESNSNRHNANEHRLVLCGPGLAANTVLMKANLILCLRLLQGRIVGLSLCLLQGRMVGLGLRLRLLQGRIVGLGLCLRLLQGCVDMMGLCLEQVGFQTLRKQQDLSG